MFLIGTVTYSFISIHTLRMEGDQGTLVELPPFTISIHTLRMEGDSAFSAYRSDSSDFNPHPPHGG